MHGNDWRKIIAIGSTVLVVAAGFFYSFALRDVRFCDQSVQAGKCGA